MEQGLMTQEDMAYFRQFGSRVVGAITKIPSDIRGLSVSELESKVMPNYQQYQFKIVFWKEYARCTLNGIEFAISEVTRKANTSVYFLRVMLDQPATAWWLMQPITDYEDQIEALLYKAMQEENGLLDLPNMVDVPVMGRDGEVVGTYKKVDRDVINLKQKIIENLKDRVRGPVEKRIATKNQNIPSNVPARVLNPQTMDAQIKELEEEVGDDKNEG